MIMTLPLRRAALVAAPLLLAAAARPDLYLIPLEGTGPSSRMAGTATLSPARSPFGLATTADGYIVFDIEVEATRLPAPAAFGPGLTTYVAWVTDHNLERVERLGALVPGGAVKGRIAFNKFMVVLTAERGPGGDRWAGPIVLRGRSPSSYLTNFSGHTMFNGGMPQ
jgi:hypothetical protein